MLMSPRFDAFGRSVPEVVAEIDERQGRFYDIRIDSHLLVYYPLPVYFWFQQADQGWRMAKRVDAGMRKLVKNGTLEKMFWKEWGLPMSW